MSRLSYCTCTPEMNGLANGTANGTNGAGKLRLSFAISWPPANLIGQSRIKAEECCSVRTG